MSDDKRMNISDEAVEAAARVSYEQSRPAILWEDMMPWWRDAYMGNLRIVLEAAAPHIITGHFQEINSKAIAREIENPLTPRKP